MQNQNLYNSFINILSNIQNHYHINDKNLDDILRLYPLKKKYQKIDNLVLYFSTFLLNCEKTIGTKIDEALENIDIDDYYGIAWNDSAFLNEDDTFDIRVNYIQNKETPEIMRDIIKKYNTYDIFDNYTYEQGMNEPVEIDDDVLWDDVEFRKPLSNTGIINNNGDKIINSKYFFRYIRNAFAHHHWNFKVDENTYDGDNKYLHIYNMDKKKFNMLIDISKLDTLMSIILLILKSIYKYIDLIKYDEYSLTGSIITGESHDMFFAHSNLFIDELVSLDIFDKNIKETLRKDCIDFYHSKTIKRSNDDVLRIDNLILKVLEDEGVPIDKRIEFKKTLEESRKNELIDVNSPCYVDNIIRYSMYSSDSTGIDCYVTAAELYDSLCDMNGSEKIGVEQFDFNSDLAEYIRQKYLDKQIEGITRMQCLADIILNIAREIINEENILCYSSSSEFEETERYINKTNFKYDWITEIFKIEILSLLDIIFVHCNLPENIKENMNFGSMKINDDFLDVLDEKRKINLEQNSKLLKQCEDKIFQKDAIIRKYELQNNHEKAEELKKIYQKLINEYNRLLLKTEKENNKSYKTYRNSINSRNSCEIFRRVRNALSHGNVEFSEGICYGDILDTEIIFKDYNDKKELTYSASIKLGELFNIILNSDVVNYLYDDGEKKALIVK